MIAQHSPKIEVYTCVMKRKPHSASLVLLLICIFTFWWGISVLSQSSISSTITVPNNQQAVSAPAAELDASNPVIVHESVSGNTYTYAGNFIPRSSCGSFGSGIKYSSDNGGHVAVLLIAKTSAVDCAQAAGSSAGEPFSVSIKVATGKSPQFDGVLLNGSLIPAQLVQDN